MVYFIAAFVVGVVQAALGLPYLGTRASNIPTAPFVASANA